MAIRILSCISTATVLLTTSSVMAQLIAPAPMPSDGFRPSGPAVKSPATSQAGPQAAPAPRGTATISQASEPTYDEGTAERLARALGLYTAIEARGGWPTLPQSTKLGPGSSGPEVALLRRRLAVTGDLAPGAATGEIYDEVVVAAIKRFQLRHGLAETGSVGRQTLNELNVSAAQRVRALSGSLERISATSFQFGQRYVVVNIPSAAVEAVSGRAVERRYVAVVGKTDRPSPMLTTRITAVNLNPTWTVPLSIMKKDIIPKMRKDPAYVARMRMRVLDGQGGEIDPKQINWKADRVPNFTIRQDSGTWNSLGAVRIDMPNPHSVYMHDTNHKNLFSADYRFQSSGCTRVADVRDFAAWVLRDQDKWGRREIDAAIATGRRTDVRLSRQIPVAWIYLTGWATRDGRVHFRPDVYKYDDVPTKPFMIALPQTVVSAARSQGFSLQSAGSRPTEIKQVSYLDSQ